VEREGGRLRVASESMGVVILVIATLVAVAALAALIVLAGRRSGKTLWDGLELLIVPLALAAVGFAFAAAQSARENRRDDRRAETDRMLAERRAAANRALAEDRQREDTLRTYLQQMSDLLLEHRLARSRFDAEQRVLATTLTLAVLRRLDGERKGVVLQFIDDAQLISNDDRKITLIGADFRGAIVDGADLESPDLARADLRGASFRSALLRSANFAYADLRGADFSSTIQDEPSFLSACLSGATFVGATLTRPSFAKSIGHDIDFRHADIADLNAARGDAWFWDLRGSARGPRRPQTGGSSSTLPRRSATAPPSAHPAVSPKSHPAEPRDLTLQSPRSARMHRANAFACFRHSVRMSRLSWILATAVRV
jgi:uncharacterized protein YjbI with pentapeptide repeats